MMTYEMALRRAGRYTPRERAYILLNLDKLWLRWFGVDPSPEQREILQRALRTGLAEEG